MANNERFLLKQFSGDANNNGVFGSYESDNATVSNDPDTIQSLPAYETGWEDATTSGAKLPRLEEMQGLQYLFCKAIKELYSEGIAFWMAGETYYLNSICAYFDENNNFALYRNISGTNGSNIPPEDTVNWVKLVIDGADKDLSNLSSTGKNIANWSSNVTNCITEIPQDIKLELNNGTLTLKAGSKVYVPNGFEEDGTTPKFDEVVIEEDKTYTLTTNGKYFLVVRQDMSVGDALTSQATSGTTPPAGTGMFYNTTTNSIDWYNSGTYYERHYSFPFALITVSDGAVSSIDQVFNGYGYIGSTVFALPGVKGSIPNGRNDDGSLNNIEFVLDSVQTASRSGVTKGINPVCIEITGELKLTVGPYTESYSTITGSLYSVYLNKTENIMYLNNGTIFVPGQAFVLTFIDVENNGTINSIKPQTVFEALDYNNTKFIGHQAMPSNRYIDLTLGVSGSSYTAPADGYFCLSKASTGTQWANLINSSTDTRTFSTSQNGDNVYLFVPAKKSDIIYSFYTLAGTTEFFRFIYAEGSK